MPNNTSASDLISEIRSLHLRLNRIENSAQLGNTAIQGGALQFVNSLGQIVLSVGFQDDGTIGVASFDPNTGVKLAQMGQINTAPSLYGLTVRQGGSMQRIAGAASAYTPGLRTTASTTPVTFGDEPSVSVAVGPSGMALVSIGALVDSALTGGAIGTPDDADVILTVDGTIPLDGSGNPLIHARGGNVPATSVSTSGIVTGLTPGVPHVFSHKYLVLSGSTTGDFLDRFVVVTPL